MIAWWLASALGAPCPLTPRTLTHIDVPLGETAAEGRLIAMVLADVGGDGKAELYGILVPEGENEAPMALWSTVVGADQGPAAAPLYPLHPLSPAGVLLAAGDIDGDDDLDLIVADPALGEIARIVGLGGDGFQVSPPHGIRIGPAPILADFAGDGIAMLLSVSPLGGASVVGLGSDPPTVADQGSMPGGSVDQALGDIDGDDRPDWVTVQGESGRIAVAWGGDLDNVETVRAKVKDARNPVIVDIDADGRAEIVVMDQARALARVIRGTPLKAGPVLFRLASEARDEPQSLHAADLDADGCVDLVAHGTANNELALAFGDGQGAFVVQRIPLGPGPVALGDVDGVGGIEIAIGLGDKVRILGVEPGEAVEAGDGFFPWDPH